MRNLKAGWSPDGEMILGIDVGQKNLGVCVLDDAANVIARWAVWDAAGTWAPDVHAMLAAHATDEFLQGVTRVVIERQPSKNPSMTRIMHYLEFFFTSLGLRVHLQDAKHKLLFAATTPWFPADATDAEWTYRHRKKLAVRTATAFVEATAQPLAPVFTESKKKDDLADALLHAMAFGTFAAVTPLHSTTAPAPKNKKVVARCPTERQRRTGKLSPSNVKHLLKGCAGEAEVAARCKADPALGRCLKRHFGGAAQFLEAVM